MLTANTYLNWHQNFETLLQYHHLDLFVAFLFFYFHNFFFVHFPNLKRHNIILLK